MDKFIIWMCRILGCLGGVLVIEGIILMNASAVIMGTLAAILFAFLSVNFEREFKNK